MISWKSSWLQLRRKISLGRAQIISLELPHASDLPDFTELENSIHHPVKSLSLIFAALVAFLAGCATTPPREVLASPARTVIVTGFEPFVRGVNVGTTIFQNREWEATPEGFDANEMASRFIA